MILFNKTILLLFFVVQALRWADAFLLRCVVIISRTMFDSVWVISETPSLRRCCLLLQLNFRGKKQRVVVKPGLPVISFAVPRFNSVKIHLNITFEVHEFTEHHLSFKKQPFSFENHKKICVFRILDTFFTNSFKKISKVKRTQSN